MLALCELGLGEDTITEAWHHPGKLVPPVYTACDVTQPHCAVMAECRLSVTFLTPSYVLAMVFPLPHFCSLFQPCIICPQNHILLFPMSTLYMRELTLGWVSQGSWASWLAAQSSQWEVAVGDRRWEERQSWVFLPFSFCLGQPLLLWLQLLQERPTGTLASVSQCPVTSLPHLVPIACR